MEDLISILPGTADFKNLDQNFDEEEHTNGGASTDQPENLLKSVFVPELSPGEPSAQLMTQKVWGSASTTYTA